MSVEQPAFVTNYKHLKNDKREREPASTCVYVAGEGDNANTILSFSSACGTVKYTNAKPPK